MVTPREILDFWYSERSRERWFKSTPDYDQEIRDKYHELWRLASDGGLAAWEATAEGALALVIILDQFPLNMLRDTPESFSTEAKAREVAGRALARGFDAGFSVDEKRFLYLPFAHSEDMDDQNRSVALFDAGGFETNCGEHHRRIIQRFGRFPHRNAILGRASTPAEIEWLNSPEGFNP